MASAATLCLVCASLLSFCLTATIRRRIRRELGAQRQANEREWAGRNLDLSPLAAQVHRLRQDYLAALRTRPHDACHRRGLVALARRSLKRRPYFRSPSKGVDSGELSGEMHHPPRGAD